MRESLVGMRQNSSCGKSEYPKRKVEDESRFSDHLNVVNKVREASDVFSAAALKLNYWRKAPRSL